MPGLLNTRRLFEGQHEDLADIATFPVIPELFDFTSIGDAAQAILDVAPKTFALGGFSMGGYVAFEIIRRAPERVEKLALIDTRATPDAADNTQRRRDSDGAGAATRQVQGRAALAAADDSFIRRRSTARK